MKKYPILGSHVSMNAQDDYLIGAIETAIQNNANTFMIFTGPPQSANRVPTKNLHITEMQQLLKEHQINIKNLVVHAPYIINLANPINEVTRKFSVDFLIKEVQRCAEIGIQTIVLHPGAYVKGEINTALDCLVKGLDLVTAKTKTIKIALETMSGKGTEVGTSFEQLKYVLDRVKNPDRIGICLDTCHLNDAGYDLNDWNGLKNDLKENFGLQKILVIHLNDSKNPMHSHKDRHENIGYGTIGFEILNQIVWDKDFAEIPKILETPYLGEQSPYQQEIADLQAQKFSNSFKALKNK